MTARKRAEQTRAAARAAAEALEAQVVLVVLVAVLEAKPVAVRPAAAEVQARAALPVLEARLVAAVPAEPERLIRMIRFRAAPIAHQFRTGSRRGRIGRTKCSSSSINGALKERHAAACRTRPLHR